MKNQMLTSSWELDVVLVPWFESSSEDDSSCPEPFVGFQNLYSARSEPETNPLYLGINGYAAEVE